MINSGEKIQSITTVASIWDSSEVMLSNELFKTLKARIGVLTLTNTQNRSVIHIPRCISNGWVAGSDKYKNLGKQEGGASAVISERIAQMLDLKPGDQIELTNELTSQQVTLWNCGENTTNKFGSSWRIHSYVATAYCGEIENVSPDEERHPGIYLNSMQIENLNLKSTLRPLCGLNKYLSVKKDSPKIAGVVKVFFQNKVVEAAVYRTNNDVYPRSAITLNPSLEKLLGGIKVGDEIRICSRFDVPNFERAERLTDAPLLEKETDSRANIWTHTFDNAKSIRDLIPSEIKDEDEVKFFLANLLDHLAKNAPILARIPERFVRIINLFATFSNSLDKTDEYNHFLKAIAKEESTLVEKQEEIFQILEKEFFAQTAKYHNPNLLDALFTMGVTIKNRFGENILHLMFRLGRGSCAESSSEKGYRSYPAFQRWMKEKTPEGKTPLHYLCQRGDWKELMSIGKKLRKFKTEDFIGPQGNPFHELAESLDKKFYQKSLCLGFIVQHLGVEALRWLEHKDTDGSTPPEKMLERGMLPVAQLLRASQLLSEKDEHGHIYKMIFDRLLSELNK